MKLIDLLKAIAVNKNNIIKNYGSHCIYINLPSEVNYIKCIDEVVQGNQDSIYNLLTKYEITLSELLTIKHNSFFFGSIYLVSDHIKDMGDIKTEEEYGRMIKELVRDYAGLLNE